MSQFSYLYYIESSFQAFASNKSSFLEAALESSLRKAEHTKPDTVKEENKYVIFQKECPYFKCTLKKINVNGSIKL